jgi:hypothetical protein
MKAAQAARNARAGRGNAENGVNSTRSLTVGRRVRLAGGGRRRRAAAGSPSAGAQQQPPAAVRASQGESSTVDTVVDAIKRSPLGLDLPADHPGLARIASSLVSVSGPLRHARALQPHVLWACRPRSSLLLMRPRQLLQKVRSSERFFIKTRPMCLF